MTEINFGSTYRIPIKQPGINAAKKNKLRELIKSYECGLIGNGNTGCARVSMPNSQDQNFIAKLKGIGYKIYQKFDGESISPKILDEYIKSKLFTRDYHQKGTNPKRLPREIRERNRYKRSFDVQEEIIPSKIEETKTQTTPAIEALKKIASKTPKQNSKTPPKKLDPNKTYTYNDYKELVEKYGTKTADMLFFTEE